MLTPAPRAALWLVILGRWSYGKSAGLLDRPEHHLVNLHRYRHLFASEVLRRPDGAFPDHGAV